MAKILLTGVPGTGKTTTLENLKHKLKLHGIILPEFIKENKLYIEYNENLDTLEYDEDKVEDFLIEYLEKNKIENFVLESHTPTTVENIKFDFIFILILKNEDLKKIYNERKYPSEKIQENIDCQNFENIQDDCFYCFDEEKIFIINRTDKNVEEVSEKILNLIKH